MRMIWKYGEIYFILFFLQVRWLITIKKLLDIPLIIFLKGSSHGPFCQCLHNITEKVAMIIKMCNQVCVWFKRSLGLNVSLLGFYIDIFVFREGIKSFGFSLHLFGLKTVMLCNSLFVFFVRISSRNKHKSINKKCPVQFSLEGTRLDI